MLQHRPGLAVDSVISMGLHQWADDLGRDDWLPLTTEPTWLNPCFFTCMLTAVSVIRARQRGLFALFGIGPLLVLLSSVTYWFDPRRTSWRRSLDLVTTRIGMSVQVCLAIICWSRRQLPAAGVLVLLGGYAMAIPCYIAGRVLTVREQRLPGAWVHGGLHLFSNLGNLRMLELVSRTL